MEKKNVKSLLEGIKTKKQKKQKNGVVSSKKYVSTLR